MKYKTVVKMFSPAPMASEQAPTTTTPTAEWAPSEANSRFGPLLLLAASGLNRARAQTAFALMLLLLLLPTLLMILSIGTADGFFIDEHQSPAMNEWSYEQQVNWRKQYKSCALRAQSPIDIQHKNVIASNHLKLHFYNYNQPTRFRLQNAHHTIKMNPINARLYATDSDQVGSASQFVATGIVQQLGGSDVVVAANSEASSSSGANRERAWASPNSASPMGHNEHLEHIRVDNNNNKQQQQQHQPSGKLDTAAAGWQHRPTKDHERIVSASSGSANGHHQLVDESVAGNNSLEEEQLQQQPREAPYEGAPTIKLDWLDDGNNEYKLRDIHFHWGERRDNGSEHAIDGRRAAMEMHLVHIKHGLDKSEISYTSDSVAVIAILIESYRKSNADFNPIVNALTRINNTDEPQEIEYKSINDLLPSQLNTFYTYSGSLTTPPCYQVVNWIVMSQRLYMNAKQIEMFRNLYAPQQSHAELADRADHDKQPSEDKLIMPNIRNLQQLNNRTILASWPKMGNLDLQYVGAYSGAHHHQTTITNIMTLVFATTVLAYFINININNVNFLR